MKKIILKYFLYNIFFILCLPSLSHSDTLKFSTYYPAPHGAYQKLEADQAQIKTLNIYSINIKDANSETLDQETLDKESPPGSISLTPMDPTLKNDSLSHPSIMNVKGIDFKAQQGTMYYDKSGDKFKFFNGVEWKDLSGTSEMYVATFKKSSDSNFSSSKGDKWKILSDWQIKDAGDYTDFCKKRNGILVKTKAKSKIAGNGLYAISWGGEIQVNAKNETLHADVRLRRNAPGSKYESRRRERTIDRSDDLIDDDIVSSCPEDALCLSDMNSGFSQNIISQEIMVGMPADEDWCYWVEVSTSHNSTKNIKAILKQDFFIEINKVLSF
ncbi:MAG: hypothetical protein A2Y04_03000 [Omnitrophica WOR_2 bacterium GWC2_45_7]|nr:MAG: hypothetical protein A2Y04_03000 [Omnitrophica WOR_2 bacterium GWC2_45_7]